MTSRLSRSGKTPQVLSSQACESLSLLVKADGRETPFITRWLEIHNLGVDAIKASCYEGGMKQDLTLSPSTWWLP